MFFKLFKHDFLDDTKKRLSALIVAVVSMAVSFCLVPGAVESMESNPYSLSLISVTSLASSVATLLMFISVLTRFHRTMFTGELYLTFTRPASKAAIILSKYLANTVWISVVSLIALANTAVFFAVSPNAEEMLLSLMDSEVYSSLVASPGTFIPLMVIFSVASSAMEVAIAQFAVTFGALIPRRSKLIIGIGIYFGATFAASTFSDVATSMVAMSMGEIKDGAIDIPMSMLPTYHISAIVISSAVSIGVSIALFFVTKLIINKKLRTALG